MSESLLPPGLREANPALFDAIVENGRDYNVETVPPDVQMFPGKYFAVSQGHRQRRVLAHEAEVARLREGLRTVGNQRRTCSH